MYICIIQHTRLVPIFYTSCPHNLHVFTPYFTSLGPIFYTSLPHILHVLVPYFTRLDPIFYTSWPHILHVLVPYFTRLCLIFTQEIKLFSSKYAHKLKLIHSKLFLIFIQNELRNLGLCHYFYFIWNQTHLGFIIAPILW